MLYFTSFILVASGTSGRHIQSIADKVIENLKNKKVQILGTEGAEAKDWILIDAGDVIINIMSEDSREHYDLESLWDRKPRWEFHYYISSKIKQRMLIVLKNISWRS